LPTSSASVERLLSIFNEQIGVYQHRAKQDTIELRTLAAYNNRVQRRRKHRFDDVLSPEQAMEDLSCEEEVIEEGQIDVNSEQHDVIELPD